MKVHFAGNGVQVNALLKAGVRYELMSFYDVMHRNDRAGGDISDWNKFTHVIVDSGLFTFMFGSAAGHDMTMEFCEDWLDKYVDFVNKTPFKNASFVELDVQKKVGSKEAWHLRKKMAKMINKGRIINVYHLEDEDPEKLIEYSDFLAVSLPELRLNVGVKERQQIMAYIVKKAHAKGTKIHILGCTEDKYLKMFSTCYSCDSTSWTSALRWGRLKSNHGTFSTRLLDVQKVVAQGFEGRERNTYWSALMSLQYYNRVAGDQT